MKRLFIGGLGHTVSEKDLKDRFGKFGDVSDVEIITRKDDLGNPLKTFGYININITDAEYKRCMGVLNKSTWKGGSLLIESAKESFLHRLAEERQQIVEQAKTPKISPLEKVGESLKAAGVENFHLKAAVPGTEIPGHKDWVVSKFGRVLPVLNLKCNGKKKVFKYDPSKHCHNIKRLEMTDDVTPVSQLTWEVPGGDDEISKKRKGEFPRQKTCPKRSKADMDSLISLFTQNNGITASPFENQQNRLGAKGNQRPADKKSVYVFDSDSEGEIRMLIAQEHLRKTKQTFTEDDDDNIEVVGDDFAVKSNVMIGNAEHDAVKSLLDSKDDEEYDSADTDEILAQRKPLCADTSKDVEAAKPSQDSQIKSRKKQEKVELKPVSSSSDSGSDEVSDDGDDDSSVDSEYEAMMDNCYRLDLSLADLENLAKKAEVAPDGENEKEPNENPKTPIASSKKKGNNPEDILASILGDETPEKENKKNLVKLVPLPAFIGTKDLFGDPATGPSEPSLKRPAQSLDNNSEVGPKRPKQDKTSVSMNKRQPSTSANLHKVSNSSSSSEDDSSSEESDLTENEDNQDVVKSLKTTHSSPQDVEKKIVSANRSNSLNKKMPKKTNSSGSSSSDSSSEESETEDQISTTHLTSSSSSPSKKVDTRPTVFHPTVPDAQKQKQDNQKRLAALEQRLKETEQQKKLIQGALSNVDAVNTNRTKHIVFDSDDDERSNKLQDKQPASQKNKLFEEDSESELDDSQEKSKQNSGGTQLFESDDDDDGGTDRFKIKPQFEGKAGRKLMALQSRFGADSRFQMGSRFLEIDDDKEVEDETAPAKNTEEELLEEKKKNLDILQSIFKTTRVEPAKAKMFKDVSALHYDPTRKDHEAFECKAKQPNVTDSKAARRKKREEAEKVPEVSKEIYFDVSADLKNVFGTPKDKDNQDATETRNEILWDEEEEDQENEKTNAQTHEDASTGFQFSFFGSDAVTETTSKTDEYKFETLKGAKFSWQADPRFQDSSSDEEGVDQVEPDQSAFSKTIGEPTPAKKTFFFFFRDDERLKEGPGMFYRSVALGEQKEAWEETRSSLQEEYRKKHRDAKRRQRPTVKT
ncbi:nucleolar protein 8 [Triplophysa dalaica]|uniref:nucleolar protein 8 n=1 Tax=Triplophysa dalaica TaxID=1582913 RepID=UPI0024DF6AF6|nr:nucleolar protein 8 [Triplophysa dalaica]XP_056615940.1 nucleolar protein 8 [Triplophysa dalaica]XP_056615941.1 nucleolar protein 8 [Triplophysa dalaica]XP_056615942.1 nucleolar protein 8 [Triplophysa dalaica]